MGGAYTSKPEIPPSNPEYPEIPIDWNPDWPFPGPNPPGYAAVDPRIAVTAPATIRAEDSGIYHAASVIGKWTDSIGGPAGLPSSTSSQYWTATISGSSSPLPLKLSTDSEFSYELAIDYDAASNYYVCAASVNFAISEHDEDKVITLRAVSYDDEGNEIEQTTTLTVVVPGNYLVVQIGAVSYPGEFTNTLTCSVGSESLSSTDGVGDEATLDTDALLTLVGDTVSATLSGTNLNALFNNTMGGTVSAFLFDRDTYLLSSVEADITKILAPSETAEVTQAIFKIVDDSTLQDLT